MDLVPDDPHANPTAWRIALDACAGMLSMNTSKGLRPLYELPHFQGSFSISREGVLAGFRLRLPLPSEARLAQAGTAAELSWESMSLDADGPVNSLGGRARLLLGRRETFTDVSALCAKIPGERPYIKIVLETVFSPVALHWPTDGWQRLRPVTLTLFSEIRPAEVGSQEPPA
ncbi:hypothetical protein [Spongiactinospora rosea]|nr:hypothetical protein [Spongiactinospora rosea]